MNLDEALVGFLEKEAFRREKVGKPPLFVKSIELKTYESWQHPGRPFMYPGDVKSYETSIPVSDEYMELMPSMIASIKDFPHVRNPIIWGRSLPFDIQVVGFSWGNIGHQGPSVRVSIQPV